MLSRTSEVHASNSEFDYLSDVDSRTYQIIISKNYCEHNVMCPNHAIYDKKEYELRAVSSISIEENSLTKNDITFSVAIVVTILNGGKIHGKWNNYFHSIWRKPIHLIKLCFSNCACSKIEHSINKHVNCMLRHIGGQTHAICNQHRHPLMPTPDRIAIFSKQKRK